MTKVQSDQRSSEELEIRNYEERDLEVDCADSDFDSDCTGDDAGSDVVYVKRGEDGHQKWCPFFVSDRNIDLPVAI